VKLTTSGAEIKNACSIPPLPNAPSYHCVWLNIRKTLTVPLHYIFGVVAMRLVYWVRGGTRSVLNSFVVYFVTHCFVFVSALEIFFLISEKLAFRITFDSIS
jgi:hypothetical protein